MDNIFIGSSKFVMSLDSLDIALLPTLSSRINNNIAPLWTANSFNGNSDKYFEFKIRTTDDAMESDNEGSYDNDTISTWNDAGNSYCHICDLEVPAAYIIDHENSLKHEAYLKIADAVLDRTRKHMLKKNCASVQKDNSMYFCSPCSTVVRTINKSNHEKSKEHKQSLSLDRLLYELVALYTNDYNETVEEYATVTTNQNVDSINEQKSEFDKNLNNNCDIVLINDVKAHLEEQERSTVECHEVDKTKPDEHNIKVNTLQNGFVNNPHTSRDMLNVNEVLNDTIVEVKTIPIVDNTNIFDNFQESDNGTFICPICNINIHWNDIESHVNGTRHAWQSKSDLHYLLRQEEGVSDLVCTICDVYIPDDLIKIRQHVATNDHVKEYKNMLKINCIIRQKGNFVCKLCNIVIMKRNELCHIARSNHRYKLASFEEIAAGFSTVEQNINEPINSCTNSPNPDAHYCAICDVNVPNRTGAIKIHNNGTRHKKNIDKITIEDTVAVPDLMEETENEKKLKCKACDSMVPNNKNNIKEHIKGKNHESSLHTILDENHIEVLGEEYICRLCKHNISLRDLFTHIKLKRHVTFMISGNETQVNSENATANTNVSTNQQEDNNATGNDDVNDNNTESVDRVYLKLKHHFRENIETNEMTCKVCNNLSIPNTIADVVNHATEQTHTNAYDNLLIDNLMFHLENNTFFCGICSCLVPLSGEVNHISGGRHNANYRSTIINEECDLCEVRTNDENIYEHLTSNEHTRNIMKKQTLVLYCECCEKLVLKNNVDDHVKTCHKLAVKGKICFCTICDPYLPGSSQS